MSEQGNTTGENEESDTDIAAQNGGGSGGQSPRTESGQTRRQDAQMTQLAIRKGWIKPLRWATDKSPEAIADAAGDRPLTIKERVEMAIGLDVIDGDPRVRGIACKTAVVMERQNQIDEHHDHPAEVPHVHSGVVGLSVVRQELLQDTSYLEYLRARAMDGATVVPESGEAEAIRTVA